MRTVFLSFFILLIFQEKELFGWNPHLESVQPDDSSLLQVLYAESATKPSGSPLTKLEILTREDSVYLNDGYLILSDYYGNLIEFLGDTLIIVSSQKNGALTKKGEGRANVSFVYDTDQPFKFHYRSIIASVPYLDFIYPYYPQSSVTLNSEVPACLWWKSDHKNYDSISYVINVTNIYGEELLNREVMGSKVEINLREFDTGIVEERGRDDYLVLINESVHGYHSIEQLHISLEATSTYTTDPCKALTSVEFLQVAMSLERIAMLKQAHEFYQMAAASSDKAIYQEFLQNYRLRNQSDE